MKAKMTGTEKEVSRIEKLRRRVDKLRVMVETEREKVAGYQQIIELYSGYIAILLEKLGATEENGVVITSAEVDEAMKKYDTRGYTKDGAVSLFIAEKS